MINYKLIIRDILNLSVELYYRFTRFCFFAFFFSFVVFDIFIPLHSMKMILCYLLFVIRYWS